MCLYSVIIKRLLQDNLIERLANEVRQANKTSIVVSEAEQVITKSASEEYNRPLTPLHVPSSDEVNLNFSHSERAESMFITMFMVPVLKYITKRYCFISINRIKVKPRNDVDVFQDEIILGDMPPLVSASVLQSGSDSYGSDVSGSEQKPKASTNQIEALIEQRISDGTRVSSISNIESKFVPV